MSIFFTGLNLIYLNAFMIPFFPNTGDGTHCFQAALMMALKHFEPARAFTYDALDRISQKLPGKWTWPTSAMLWLMGEGYKLKLIEEFDYHAFAARGVDFADVVLHTHAAEYT